MNVYHERCGLSALSWMGVALLLLGVPTILVLSGGSHAIPLAAGFFVVLGLVAYKFSSVELRVSDDGVEYGFRGLNNRVSWDRVVSLEPEKYAFFRYWGYGYRIGGRRDRAYSIVGPESGVRLRFRDEKDREWSIFLASRDPIRAAETAKRKLS